MFTDVDTEYCSESSERDEKEMTQYNDDRVAETRKRSIIMAQYNVKILLRRKQNKGAEIYFTTQLWHS